MVEGPWHADPEEDLEEKWQEVYGLTFSWQLSAEHSSVVEVGEKNTWWLGI